MKAIVRDTYGSADVLELRDIDIPEIADDEVLVRVHAAGVGRDVWHVMTGLPYPIRLAGYGLRAPKNPVIGSDVAGVVEAVGKDVTRFQPGDEVFGIGKGSYAEYVCAREDKLAPKPENLTFEQAAVVAIIRLDRPARPCATTERCARGRRCSSSVPREEWAPTPCRSPRRSARTSPACAAPRRWRWSDPSARIRSSTTRARTSPRAISATT